MRKILVFTFVFLLISCKEEINCMFVTNNSNDSIYMYAATGYYDDYKSTYPDTMLPMNVNNHYIPYLVKKASPNSKGIIFEQWFCDFSKEFKRTLPKDTLSVFIISCDTLNKYGYDVVAKENKILVRYDLSIPDLERMNYNIPYPPAPWMKDMKMYPSYDKVVNRYK